MKKTVLLISGIMAVNGLFAQNNQNANPSQNENNVTFKKCSAFSISQAIRDLPDVDITNSFTESNDEHDRRRMLPIVNSNANNKDGALQVAHGIKSMASIVQNWQGQSGTGCPPDPTGAAGLTQYAQAVNTAFRVYNKSTGAPLINAKDLKTFWPGSIDAGDPIVLYDKAADRWFIMQFQLGGGGGNNKILIAISTTNDATGTYYLYTFTPDASDQPDYPKFAIWSDGYYMTSNYTNEKIVVFDRTKMLAGNTGAGMIVKPLPSGFYSGGFFCPLAGDASDSQLPPSSTTYCPIFSYEDDSWGAPHDQLRIWKMHVDFTTPNNTTLISDQTLQTAPFDAASFSSGWNDIAQPGTSQKLDAIAGVLNYRAQYRVWTGYNSVVICHAVKINTSPGQVGIRWYELRQDQTTKVWSIYQQSTLAPDALNRWVGSIGMDDNGSIGLAYCVSGSTAPNYLSIRYTGRTQSDPINTMTFAEQTAIASTSALTSCSNRDGDYSHLMLDPDGQTFWHTAEYVVSSNPATRIYSFKLSSPPIANFTAATTQCAGQPITMTDNSSSTPTSWSWTMTGGTPATSTSQSPAVTYSTAGTYTVTLVATNSSGSSAPVSQTITVNAVPTVPTINLSGNTFTSSSATGNQWYLNGVLINGATNQTYTASSSGTYTVAVINSSGCSSISAGTAYSNNNPPTANFTASTNDCSGQAITISDNSTNTPTSWNWTLTGGTPPTSTAQNPSVTYSASGTYSVTLVSTNSFGTSAPVTQSITVNTSPSTPTINQSGNTLTSSSATGNQWYLNGVILNGATNQAYTAVTSGTYTVAVTNSFGCASTSAGTNLTTLGITSYAGVNSETVFYVYQLDNYLNVKANNLPSNMDFVVDLFDIAGQKITGTKVAATSNTLEAAIDISGLAKGVYLVRIGNINFQKVIKVALY